MPRSRACRRTSAHCSKKSHCSNSTSRTSRASSRRARASAASSRFTRARSQVCQAAPPFARFRAMKRAKSASQASSVLTKASSAARRAGPAFLSKAAKALASSGRFHSMTGPKSTSRSGKVGPLLQVGARDEPLLAQAVERDEERVAGEGREALVRRVAVAGGAEGQDLPQALAGLLQEVEEGGRLRAQLSDAVGTGQRRGVEQDPGGALAHGGYSILTSTDWLRRFPRSSFIWTLTASWAGLR